MLVIASMQRLWRQSLCHLDAAHLPTNVRHGTLKARVDDLPADFEGSFVCGPAQHADVECFALPMAADRQTRLAWLGRLIHAQHKRLEAKQRERVSERATKRQELGSDVLCLLPRRCGRELRQGPSGAVPCERLREGQKSNQVRHKDT